MCMLNIFLCFLVIQAVNNVSSQNLKNVSSGSKEGCILPPHPSFGRWSHANQSSQSSPGLTVPANSVLRVQCEDKYGLDGCNIVACIDGKWMPKIGQCLKKCPSIYSTSTTNVTCIFKEQETVNCTEPIEGTFAKFKCASFYEDTRKFKSKVVCVDGRWSERIPECSPVCGRIASKKRPLLTVHGNEPKKGDFPWQIGLYASSYKGLVCGGSLLSETVILTAAHCISDEYGDLYPKDKFFVVAGKYTRKFHHPDDQNYIQVSKVHEMFIPDKYKGDYQYYEGDIAIIIPKKAFKFSPQIQPICIDWARKFEHFVVRSGQQKGYVSGWGKTEAYSEPAHELRVPSIPREECQKNFPRHTRFVTPDKFCAGYKGNGTISYLLDHPPTVCGEHSGGGLVFEREGRFFIAGVVSLVPLANEEQGECDIEQFTLYTLVYNYIDNFIVRKLVEFKTVDTEVEDCQNCTNVVSSTTEAPTKISPVVNSTTEVPTKISPVVNSTTEAPSKTTEQPPGACILPQHPDSGRWHIFGPSAELFPGDYVPPFSTALTMSCNIGYEYIGVDFIVCKNGKWTVNIGKCLKLCPPLYNVSRMTVTCTYGENLAACHYTVDGTVAKFKCTPFYESSNWEEKPSICINGKWNFVPNCVPICGKKSEKNPEGHYPWNVLIYKKQNKKVYVPTCGGSLISTKLIITAAHCLTDENHKLLGRSNYIVTAGSYHREFNKSDANAQFSKVDKMLIPRQYRGDLQNYGDIAIIVVETAFELSDVVQPVCIDWSSKTSLPLDKEAFLSSWSLENSTWIEKEHKLKILSSNECLRTINEDYSEYLTADKFCAEFLSNDSFLCKGSTGLGLVYKSEGKYYHGGVLSVIPKSPVTEICDFVPNVLFTQTDNYVYDFIFKAEAKNKKNV